MNKRQANFIMQLPDGYEWEFLNNGEYVIGYSGRNVLLYEIVGDELIQREIGFNNKVIKSNARCGVDSETQGS